jgi:uncharacterized membrane protein (UPF0127 family)
MALRIRNKYDIAFAWAATQTGQLAEDIAQQAIDDVGENLSKSYAASEGLIWNAKKKTYDAALLTNTKAEIEAAFLAT